MTDFKCTSCNDTGWVCERHHNIAWDDGDDGCPCGGAGNPCKICNSWTKEKPPRDPPSFQVLFDHRGYIQ